MNQAVLDDWQIARCRRVDSEKEKERPLGTEVPAVSIITIVKNNDRLLPRAVESVLSQSLADYEYIIVNDGSTDGTAHLIDTYVKKDSRVRANHLSENVGRAMARNKGLSCAKGQFIFFLDADDYLPESALQDLFEVASTHDADVVYGGIRCFDKDTGHWLKKHYTDDIIDKERHHFQLDDHLPLVLNHTLVGRLFQREMLLKNNILFSDARKNGEDVLFCFYTAYYAENLSMAPGICSYYYSIGNFIDAANEQKLFDARDNVQETIQFAIKNGSALLKKTMQKKGAVFAASLERAYKVYAGRKKELTEYVSTLLPLVADISNEVLADLPGYPQCFTKALLSRNFAAALSMFEKNRSEQKKPMAFQADESSEKIARRTQAGNMEPASLDTIETRIAILKSENAILARRLDALYHSSSWRITAPLRFIARVFRK